MPMCLSCSEFKGFNSGSCTVYPKGIPQSIYPKGGNCSHANLPSKSKRKVGARNGSRKIKKS